MMIGYETRRWLPAAANERFYQLRRRGRKLSAYEIPRRFDEVVSREHLFTSFQELQQQGGPAAGVDGVRLDEIGPSEFGRIAQQLSKSLREGTYRPAPTRRQPVPKKDGEMRELRIATICDRVVAKALHRVLTPAYDEAFFATSWGFRPQRSASGMLADLLATMETEKRWVIAVEDIRRAFDSVPLDAVLDAHHQLLPRTPLYRMRDEEVGRLLALVETVLRGADPHRTIGIDQGSNDSEARLTYGRVCAMTPLSTPHA